MSSHIFSTFIQTISELIRRKNREEEKGHKQTPLLKSSSFHAEPFQGSAQEGPSDVLGSNSERPGLEQAVRRSTTCIHQNKREKEGTSHFSLTENQEKPIEEEKSSKRRSSSVGSNNSSDNPSHHAHWMSEGKKKAHSLEREKSSGVKRQAALRRAMTLEDRPFGPLISNS